MKEFKIQLGDVLEVQSDILLLKHAQGFYGADKAVADHLVERGLCKVADLTLPPGKSVIIETKGSIAPKRVMFLGTPRLHDFDYDEMQIFASKAIEEIATLGLQVRTLTTTVHGTGYGLDGGEALQRLITGFQAELSKGIVRIDEIIFVTMGERAQRMLATILKNIHVVEHADDGGAARSHSVQDVPKSQPTDTPAKDLAPPDNVDVAPAEKKRVFVAMPFSEEFQNVYEFGIYPAVRNCGLICERVDESHFTGDVLRRIRDGIESASLVIADLTEGRPNVYLEVGYAWGRDIPVIFVARKKQKLHFDVSTHRCIFYGGFTQFSKDLEQLIRGIEGSAHK